MIERIGRSPRTKLAAVAIAIVLAGAAAGALATLAIAPTYAATTTVLVGSLDRPSIANDFDVSSGVASIYGNLIRSEAVLGPVIQRLGLPTDWQEARLACSSASAIGTTRNLMMARSMRPLSMLIAVLAISSAWLPAAWLIPWASRAPPLLSTQRVRLR